MMPVKKKPNLLVAYLMYLPNLFNHVDHLRFAVDCAVHNLFERIFTLVRRNYANFGGIL